MSLPLVPEGWDTGQNLYTMSTVSDAINYARAMCQTDSNGISDANGLIFASDAKNNIIRALVEHDIDAAQTKEAYLVLSPSDNPIGQFNWPSDMFGLKTVEIDYTASGGQNYLQAQPLDVANIQFVSWDYLRANQPTNMPLFDNRGDKGEVFPSPFASALIRIFYFLQPADYSSISDTISYPISLDYRMLGTRIAALYETSLGDENMALGFNTEFATRLQDVIKILAPSSQQPIQATAILISGWGY